MQDIRLRTGCAVLLSLTAFVSLTGAGAVFLWWLLFARPLMLLRTLRRVIPAVALTAFFGIVLAYTGGDGLSYTLRMTVIILVGAWICHQYQPGEFISFGTWLFGNGIGFDLGLIADTGMQSLDLLVSDLRRIRQAYAIKTGPLGIRTLVPAGDILIHGVLRRADETAELMAIRGYRYGGSGCPVFRTPPRDIAAMFAAICMGIIAVVPVSEFFILYH